MGPFMNKTIFGVHDHVKLKQAFFTTEAAHSKFTKTIIVSRKHNNKGADDCADRCAGWSRSVLFAYNKFKSISRKGPYDITF